MNKFILFLRYICVLPHLLYFLCSKNRGLIEQDMLAKKNYGRKIYRSILLSIMNNLIFDKGFRYLFYLRIGGRNSFLKLILPPADTLEFEGNKDIGGGMVIIHPFSIVINGAVSIGKNCTLLHNVTIGIAHDGTPTVGDNVYIGCGATIIGNVHIGNNCKIGANALVLSDVPDNCTAVGNPARIIKHVE